MELWLLDVDDLNRLIAEIEDSMERFQEELEKGAIDELMYKPPDPTPAALRFVFDELGPLQALYQSPDHSWDMVFEDGEDGTQVVVMMSTGQVKRFLEEMRVMAHKQ